MDRQPQLGNVVSNVVEIPLLVFPSKFFFHGIGILYISRNVYYIAHAVWLPQGSFFPLTNGAVSFLFLIRQIRCRQVTDAEKNSKALAPNVLFMFVMQ